MDAPRLRQFAARVRGLTGGREDVRPFVCDGDPYACTAFVVGFNPASTLPEPFWMYWTDALGFDKAGWLDAYSRARVRAGKRPLSNTRQRLNWIADGAAPERILETNLFTVPTPREADLRPEDRRSDGLLDFLLGEIRPRAVLLHGKPTRTAFGRRYGCLPNETFTPIRLHGRFCVVAAVRHFARGWSRAAAVRMGECLREACGVAAAGSAD